MIAIVQMLIIPKLEKIVVFYDCTMYPFVHAHMQTDMGLSMVVAHQDHLCNPSTQEMTTSTLIEFLSLTCFIVFTQDVKRYKLGNPTTFHYLNQSNCYKLDGVDDSKEYLTTRKAMDVVGISPDEQVYHL